MSFRPINADHAIEIVRFSLLLKDAVDQAALNAIQSNHKLWRSELPAFNVPQIFEMQMDPGGAAPRTRSDRGIEFSFLRPDGTPAWTLRVIGHEIAVECSRYTRWDKVWGRTHSYFSAVLQVLGSGQSEQAVVGVSLNVVDKFISDTEPYNLASLVLKNPYVADNVFSSGATWHNHLGWFEEFASGLMLHNLNMDARRERSPAPEREAPSIVLAINHFLQTRLPRPIPVSAICVPEGASPLANAMDFMHRSNKQMVGTMLVPEMRERIGLEVVT